MSNDKNYLDALVRSFVNCNGKYNISDIAKELNVTRQTVYNKYGNVKNLRDDFLKYIQKKWNELHEELKEGFKNLDHQQNMETAHKYFLYDQAYILMLNFKVSTQEYNLASYRREIRIRDVENYFVALKFMDRLTYRNLARIYESSMCYEQQKGWEKWAEYVTSL